MYFDRATGPKREVCVSQGSGLLAVKRQKLHNPNECQNVHHFPQIAHHARRRHKNRKYIADRPDRFYMVSTIDCRQMLVFTYFAVVFSQIAQFSRSRPNAGPDVPPDTPVLMINAH